MKNELYHLQHPARLRIFWIVIYVIITASFVAGMYITANKIRTHSLPSGQIQLTVPYSKYLVGEAVSFSIKNNYNSPVYVLNSCPGEPLAVYRQDKGKWVRIHDQAALSDCPEEQRQVSVPANGIVNGTFAPWHHLFDKPGRYRVVAFVEYYNALPYQEFEVINAPPISQPDQVSVSLSSKLPSSSVSNSKPTPSTRTSPVATPAPTTTKQSYIKTVNGAGTISAQYDSTNIYVTTITPASGCTYEGGQSGPQVEVTFICGARQTQIQLNILNGQIVARIEAGN